jgi:hypothetical protein
MENNPVKFGEVFISKKIAICLMVIALMES